MKLFLAGSSKRVLAFDSSANKENAHKGKGEKTWLNYKRNR